ncbi:MAG: hypothetical protein AB1916_03255 [Thermodesulfobacteriota bacterium]
MPQPVADLDPNFQDRAMRLIEDAKTKAMSNYKIGPSVQGYLFTTDFKEKVVTTVVNVGVGVGKTLAAAAIIAAGVSSAAVTFGIGPVIGVVVGFAVAKGLGEAKYQYKTYKLRKGIEYDPSGDDKITEPSLIEPAVMKIQRKLDRVGRRHAMLKGGHKGRWNKFRHMKTAISSAFKSDMKPAEQFPGLRGSSQSWAKDRELNERLLELNYYSQMLGNFINITLDAVIKERDRYIDYADLIFAHVVRQVHYTGNHMKCGKDCYTMPEQEFNDRMRNYYLRMLRTPGLQISSKVDPNTVMQFYAQRLTAWNKLGGTDTLIQNVTSAQTVGQPPEQDKSLKEMAKEYALDKVKPAKDESDVERYMDNPLVSKIVDTGLGKLTEVMVPLEGSIQDVEGGKTFMGMALEQTGSVTGATVGAEFASAGVGEVLNLTVSEVKDSVKKRLIKRAVLKKKDRAFNLLSAQTASQDEAHRALEEFNKKDKDVMSRSERVAQKIYWYLHKIHKIETEFKTKQLAHLASPANFEMSSFETCKDAKNVAYTLHYLFKQYEKAITFMVYLETILLGVDRKLAGEIGFAVGSVFKPGEPTPTRPPHMKAV